MKKFKVIKVDHIAIATKTSKNINNFLLKMLDEKEFEKEEVKSEQVITSIFNLKNINIETLEPTSNESSISSYLNKNGEGLHHIAFLVDNIKEAILFFKSNKVRVIYDPPKIGASNKLITFLHPKDTFGILIEISQNK